MRCLALLKAVILVILVIIVRIDGFNLRDYFLQCSGISIRSCFRVSNRWFDPFGLLNRINTILTITANVIKTINSIFFAGWTLLNISQPGSVTAIAANDTVGIVVNALGYIEICLLRYTVTHFELSAVRIGASPV